MKGRGDEAWCTADEFIGRTHKQIEKPVLVGRIYREDIYQADHAVRRSQAAHSLALSRLR